MKYYRESRQLVEQANEMLESGEQRRNLGKWFLVPFSTVSGIALAAAIGWLSKNYVAACLVAAAGTAMGLLSYQAINRMLKRFQSLKSTIPLNDTDIILQGGFGKVGKIISYKNIERAEVVPMLGRVRMMRPNGANIYEKMYFICLHTEYIPIEIGIYAFRYERDERVIMFPYDASAWELLSERIPESKMSGLENALPLKAVEWHKLSYRPVNGSILDGDMPLLTKSVGSGMKK